jgi:DNA polymerase-3 subunit epsilon
MKERILFIDTETGGINPDVDSLLSIGLVCWENGEILAKKEIFIKHKEYHIVKRAQSINGITEEFLEKYGITEEMAINELLDFCKLNFSFNNRITIAGHNISFDVNFLKKLFKNNNLSFSKYFSHRFIDTASILMFLSYANKLPNGIISSSEAFKYYGIYIENRHSAVEDALATAKMFTKILKNSK